MKYDEQITYGIGNAVRMLLCCVGNAFEMCLLFSGVSFRYFELEFFFVCVHSAVFG